MTTLNVELSGLIPFADYRISVKCIQLVEIEIDSFSPRGYWSNAVHIRFTTQPDGMAVVMKLSVT